MKDFTSILYIEDSPEEAEIIQRLYLTVRKKFHGEVTFKTSDTWEKGAAYVAENHPNVVILDLVLPPDTADVTLERIRQVSMEWPPILVLTGNRYDLTLRPKSIEAGADDFMVKDDARHGCCELLCERVYHCFLRRNREKRA